VKKKRNGPGTRGGGAFRSPHQSENPMTKKTRQCFGRGPCGAALSLGGNSEGSVLIFLPVTPEGKVAKKKVSSSHQNTEPRSYFFRKSAPRHQLLLELPHENNHRPENAPRKGGRETAAPLKALTASGSAPSQSSEPLDCKKRKHLPMNFPGPVRNKVYTDGETTRLSITDKALNLKKKIVTI